MKRRWFLTLSIFSVLVTATLENRVMAAEKYPVKPITYISAVAAGDDADVLYRPLLQRASKILGKPIMVVNKPGAGMTIGYRELLAAKPDGYTIGLTTGTSVSNKLQGLMPFDYHDFTIIGAYAVYVPIIVAGTKSSRPFKSIQEVISFAKANPGEISISTSHVGGVWWISTMYFQESTGLKFNIIPQTAGGALAIAQVAGGHTDLAVLATGAAKSQIEAGNVRVLAVYGNKRFPGRYADIPTLKEAGYDIQFESTQMVVGPAKMPKDIADQLVGVFKEAATHPDYVKYIEEQNAIPMYLTPEQTFKRLEEQRKIYRDIMEKAGVLKEK